MLAQRIKVLIHIVEVRAEPESISLERELGVVAGVGGAKHWIYRPLRFWGRSVNSNGFIISSYAHSHCISRGELWRTYHDYDKNTTVPIEFCRLDDKLNFQEQTASGLLKRLQSTVVWT